MRLGADPDQLERLAGAYDTCAAHLARVRRRLRSSDRSAWTGAGSLRWWSHVDVVVLGSLARAGAASSVLATRVRTAAREQRRASLSDPATATLRLVRGGDGRWVGRVGPPRAEIVAVLIPGVGTDVSHRGALLDDARRAWASTVARSDGLEDRVAVVAWLGYDAPDHVILGVDGRPAAAGASQLVRDVAALRRDGARRIVLVGHSYGGLVATAAVSAGLPVDELILLGAPGLGVRDAASLALGPGADLWTAQARRDPIGLVARAGVLHGADPQRHGLHLPTSSTGHGSYLEDAVLLDALAEVILDIRRPGV